jgi:hypothetical protein
LPLADRERAVRGRDRLRKLRVLLDAAKDWGTTRPIVNVETEIKPSHLGGLITPEEVGRELERAGMDEAAVSTRRGSTT